ncbi:nicotinate phosphoribosyltransferase [Marinilabilia rubra]|uniref:Nicotinate phosphoribosyltransferase n=1 Tax=Marinilabilia rubra TaxID=2162893 RepID=A0A2U2BEF7_9BACT|nr:nicotinate phosphoribosyltransferase [Marinilabilia rubra]PWE01442.1 nicotinate phosphoribosyltransferase [Marinilabilia rubra]
MDNIQSTYKNSMALLTDFYEITMAYGFWKNEMHQQKAAFNLFFRNNPFSGGFSIACGLEYVVDFLNHFSFTDSDIDYLASLNGNDGKPLFEKGFLDYLQHMTFECDVEAIPEGTIVFPNEPLIKVKGPLLQCQLIESALLNFINFQTLIATKAARISIAAKGDPVMEFGLRRAQGIDGSLSASRASFIGGCAGTSNVLAGKKFNIPVLGTHAHSWVQAFEDELKAFDAFANTLPNNTIFLVDTYNTPRGIDKAIEITKKMETRGHKINGIRLDSGDLAYFSQLARGKLREAGLSHVKIVASNDLDEHLVASLKDQEAEIDSWGIGTKLVTAYDQPALGGVYKLSAIENKNGEWENRIKLSEQSIKINIPGLQQVKRFYKDGKMAGDMIFDERTDLSGTVRMIDPADPTRSKKLNKEELTCEDLLKPVFCKGQCVYEKESIQKLQERTSAQLNLLDKTIKRFANPHRYPVGLEEGLYQRRLDLILKYKQESE